MRYMDSACSVAVTALLGWACSGTEGTSTVEGSASEGPLDAEVAEPDSERDAMAEEEPDEDPPELADDGSVAQARCGVIRATVRDFTPSHPDFESALFTARNEAEAMRAETGLVEAMLGFDHKPLLRSTGDTRAQITSESSFASWYVDDPAVNRTLSVELVLEEQPDGLWVYDNAAFFPADGLGFGNFPNASAAHNYHFTTEIHVRFRYEQGQRFTFRGDDDLWLFVGGKLALDLGGLHLPVSGTVDMDMMAGELGLAPGQETSMDIFHAERHTEQSNFHVETNIQCFQPVL